MAFNWASETFFFGTHHVCCEGFEGGVPADSVVGVVEGTDGAVVGAGVVEAADGAFVGAGLSEGVTGLFDGVVAGA